MTAYSSLGYSTITLNSTNKPSIINLTSTVMLYSMSSLFSDNLFPDTQLQLTVYAYACILLSHLSQSIHHLPINLPCSPYHRKAMGVPAKASLHMVSILVCPPCHHIFDGTSQNVPVVWQSRGKRWAIIEGEPEVENMSRLLFFLI